VQDGIGCLKRLIVHVCVGRLVSLRAVEASNQPNVRLRSHHAEARYHMVLVIEAVSSG